LQTEIALVEASVDVHEREALTQANQVYSGAPEAIVVLGKLVFFDKSLSVNRNTACGFCHTPETGFQSGSELINRTSVHQPGPVRTRFSLRKPPSAAYAAFSVFDKTGRSQMQQLLYRRQLLGRACPRVTDGEPSRLASGRVANQSN
jgi:cytochrome c peroxidase